MIRVVLFDLDGVLRHFDPAAVAAIEVEHDLSPGSIHGAAFEPGLLHELVTGRTSRADWVRAVGRRVGSHEAAQRWSALPATVDDAVVALARRISAAGITTAILTNGTDETSREVRGAGFDEVFDPILNSADFGVAKPEPAVYARVSAMLGVAPDEVLFVDDTESHIAGAAAAGWRTRLFVGAPDLEEALRVEGVPVTGPQAPSRVGR